MKVSQLLLIILTEFNDEKKWLASWCKGLGHLKVFLSYFQSSSLSPLFGNLTALGSCLHCVLMSLTVAVNVGSVEYHCLCLLKNDPKMQKVCPNLDLEFKCWGAWGHLDLLNAMTRGANRRSHSLLWPWFHGGGKVYICTKKHLKLSSNLASHGDPCCYHHRQPDTFVCPSVPQLLHAQDWLDRTTGWRNQDADVLVSEKALQEFAQHNKSKQVTGKLVFFPDTMIVIIIVT